MSDPFSSSPPERYPGYFPAAKPPFWTRTKVGAAAGVLGLLIGAGAGVAAGVEEPTDAKIAPAASTITEADVRTRVEAAVGDVRQDLNGDLAAQETAAEADLSDARSQWKADLRLVKQEARTSKRVAVAKAVAAAEKAQPDVQPVPDSPAPDTDPRFSYCYEANDAGYGDYVQGQDPEYAWYDDTDNDGVVCET